MKIKGPSGLVIDVPKHVATGLIGGGHAEAVSDSPKKPEPKKEPAKSTK